MDLLFAESEARIMREESISISEELYMVQREIGRCFSECKMEIDNASKITTYEARLYGEAEDGKPNIFKRIWEKIKSILKTIIKYILKFVNGILGLLNKVFGTSWKIVIKSVNGDGESSSGGGGGGGGSSGGSGGSGGSDSGSGKSTEGDKPKDNTPPPPANDTGTFIGKFMNQVALGNALKEIDNVLPGFNEKVISEKDVLNPTGILNRFTDFIKDRNTPMGMDTKSKEDVIELMKDIFSNSSENMSTGKNLNTDNNPKTNGNANISDDGDVTIQGNNTIKNIASYKKKMNILQSEILNSHGDLIKYAVDVFNTNDIKPGVSKKMMTDTTTRVKDVLDRNKLSFAFDSNDNVQNVEKMIMSNMQNLDLAINAKVLTPILKSIYSENGHGAVTNILPEGDIETRIVTDFTFGDNASRTAENKSLSNFTYGMGLVNMLLLIYNEGISETTMDDLNEMIIKIQNEIKKTPKLENLNAKIERIANTIRLSKNKAGKQAYGGYKMDKETMKAIISSISELVIAIEGDTGGHKSSAFVESNGIWSNSDFSVGAKSKTATLSELMVDTSSWFDDTTVMGTLTNYLNIYKNEIKEFDTEKGFMNNAAALQKNRAGELPDEYRNEITKLLKDSVSSLQKTAVEANKYTMTIYKAVVALKAVKYNNALMRFIPQYQAQAMAYTLLHKSYTTYVEKNNETLKNAGEAFQKVNREIEEAHNEFVSKLRII